MEVKSSTQVTNINNLQTQINNININNFSNILNNLQISKDPLPADAYEKIKQGYKDNFTDEKYDELIEKLDIKNLSDSDKELIKTIIDDRVITKDEINDLSYEQIVTLNKFIMKKDSNNNYIEETMVSMYYDVSNIMNIPLISNDENFNKTIFNQAIDMEDTRGYMALITGTHNFPWDKNNHIDYNSGDPDDILRELIYDYEQKLETSTKIEVIEYYKNAINIFSNLIEDYDRLKGEDMSGIDNQDNYNFDIIEDLFNDLMSIIRTGLTVSEIESLEKLTAEINKLINDSENKEVSSKKVEDMIKLLEQKLEELQKRLGGSGEIDADKNLETKHSNSKTINQTMKDFKSMVKSLEIELDKIKEQNKRYDSFSSTQDELNLREQLKKNS
ncbi:MAG: hypothetical protein DRG78_01695 [Epsilonproteobacteria bacterium]|nr:MAG: hypothetical protein DRG78_01695 [Campylobacterota bacterium]